MKMLTGSLILLLLLGTVPVAWGQADPAKEVADIGRKRAEAAAKGDVDGFVADVVDNVMRVITLIDGVAVRESDGASDWPARPVEGDGPVDGQGRLPGLGHRRAMPPPPTGPTATVIC